uniref:E3 ubiquitin protein ligase n=1 Tax=Eutreptiella gymnastica TaxID=73025 RepID=A0A7S4GIB7_9EUGL|mmetsp:Transcript_87808/g.146624  ORF Transcript_87808/g.146624 Transcript_87808/m.146624 type:complete len:763 (+) Transcript_87808:14-2302(+)
MSGANGASSVLEDATPVSPNHDEHDDMPQQSTTCLGEGAVSNEAHTGNAPTELPHVIAQTTQPTTPSDSSRPSSPPLAPQEPSMCSMKMMFKRFPQLQTVTPTIATTASEPVVATTSGPSQEEKDEPSLKRDREADTQVEHPLKKLALAQYNKEAMGASTGPPPLKKLALAQYHKDPNNSKVSSGSLESHSVASSSTQQHTNMEPLKVEAQVAAPMWGSKPTNLQDAVASEESSSEDVATLQQKIKELETDLFYTKDNLMHEQKRWLHFRKRARNCNIWAVLMGIADPSAPTTDPAAPTSKQSSLSKPEVSAEFEAQLEEAQDALLEQTTRAESLAKETVRLSAENQDLQSRLLLQKAKDAQVDSEGFVQQMLEHPLYKKLMTCYHEEHIVAQKYGQQLEQVREELRVETRRCQTMQEKIEEHERKMRKKLEHQLHEKDAKLLDRDALHRDLSYRLKRLEAVSEQAADEQLKVKEYSVLVNSLRRESEKLRHRLRKDHHDDLAKEVENISKAYEDMSEQNSRLLSQMEEKDRLSNNLLTERLKNQHNIQLLKAELQTQREHLETTEKLRANQEMWIEKMYGLLETMHNAERHSCRQNSELQTLGLRQHKELVALKLQNEELLQQVEHLKGAGMSFTEEAERLTRVASANEMDNRKKTEELHKLQSKHESLKKKAEKATPQKAPKATESAELLELREKVEAYRIVLNCNVCNARRKDTIITKCLHVFCSQCVEENLRDRKRKCPQCAMKFSESDVKHVYLSDV